MLADLLIKLIIGIAVAYIAYLGYRLQERIFQRDAEAKRANRTLVTLQGIAEAELLVREGLLRYGRRSYSLEEGEELQDYGLRLASASEALFAGGVEEVVRVPFPATGRLVHDDAQSQNVRADGSLLIPMQLDAAVKFFGELSQVIGLEVNRVHEYSLKASVTGAISRPWFKYDPNQFTVHVEHSANPVHTDEVQYRFDARTVDAWQLFLPHDAHVHFYADIDMAPGLQFLQRELARATVAVLSQHPELGDRFQAIRANLLENRQLYLPERRPRGKGILALPEPIDAPPSTQLDDGPP